MILPPLPIPNLPNPVAKLEGKGRNPVKAKVAKPAKPHSHQKKDLARQNPSLPLPTPLLHLQTDPHLEAGLDILILALLVQSSYVLHLYLQANLQWLLLHLPIILLVSVVLLGPVQHPQQPPPPLQIQPQPIQLGPNFLQPQIQQRAPARRRRQA